MKKELSVTLAFVGTFLLITTGFTTSWTAISQARGSINNSNNNNRQSFYNIQDLDINASVTVDSRISNINYNRELTDNITTNNALLIIEMQNIGSSVESVLIEVMNNYGYWSKIIKSSDRLFNTLIDFQEKNQLVIFLDNFTGDSLNISLEVVYGQWLFNAHATFIITKALFVWFPVIPLSVTNTTDFVLRDYLAVFPSEYRFKKPSNQLFKEWKVTIQIFVYCPLINKNKNNNSGDFLESKDFKLYLSIQTSLKYNSLKINHEDTSIDSSGVYIVPINSNLSMIECFFTFDLEDDSQFNYLFINFQGIDVTEPSIDKQDFWSIDFFMFTVPPPPIIIVYPFLIVVCYVLPVYYLRKRLQLIVDKNEVLKANNNGALKIDR